MSQDPQPQLQPSPDQLDYLLRRAEQETIAAMRSLDPRAAAPHEQMACVYGAQVASILSQSSLLAG